jgi:hypothetical protein
VQVWLPKTKGTVLDVEGKVEEFIHDVAHYFQVSSKRNKALKELQEFFNAPEHRILRLAETRWLSRYQVIDRLLEQWDMLYKYFQTEVLEEDPDKTNPVLRRIWEHFHNPGPGKCPPMKVLLMFLHHVLKMVTDVNLRFQQQSSKIYEVRPVISDLLGKLLCMFMQDGFFREHGVDLEKLNRRITSDDIKRRWLVFHRKPEQVVIGPPAIDELSQNADFNLHTRALIKKACLRYLVCLTSELVDRFDLSPSSNFAKCEFLNPLSNYAMYDNLDGSSSEVTHLMDLHRLLGGRVLTTEDVHQIGEEWMRFKLKKDEILEKYFTEQDREAPNFVTKFWLRVQSIENFLKKKQYTALAKLALAALTVPHATAFVERVFSSVARVKGRDSNCMITVTLEGRLLASQLTKRSGCCVKFKPSQRLVDDVLNGQCRRRYFEDMKVQNDGKVRVTPISDEGWENFEAEVEAEQQNVDSCIERVPNSFEC